MHDLKKLRLNKGVALAIGGACMAAPFLLFFIPLFLDAAEILGDFCYRGGDFPLLLIWVQNAQSFDTLSGQYSRLGFHHPGPLMAYFYAAWTVLLGEQTPSYRGIELAQLSVNALLTGVSMWALYRISNKFWAPILLLVFCLISFQATKIAVLHDPWAPSVLLTPTLCFISATVLVLSGRLAFVLPWTISAMILMSSHLGTLPLVSGLAVLGLVTNLYNKEKVIMGAGAKISLVLSGIVVLLSFSPLAVDAVLSRGGNPLKIVEYVLKPSSSLGLIPSLKIISSYAFPWFEGSVALALIMFVCLGGLLFWTKRHRYFALTLMVAMCLLIFSFAQVARPPHSYIFWFTSAFVVLLWCLIFLVLAEKLRLKRRGEIVFMIMLLPLALFISWEKQKIYTADGCLDPSDGMYEEIVAELKDEPGIIYLRQRGANFPHVANLYLRLKEEGREVCIARGAGFFLSEANACPERWPEASLKESFTGISLLSTDKLVEGTKPDFIMDDVAVLVYGQPRP